MGAGVGLGVRFAASPFARASMGGGVNDFVAQQAVLAAEAEVMRYAFPGSAAAGGAPGHASARGMASAMGMLGTIEDEGEGMGRVGVGTSVGGAGAAGAAGGAGGAGVEEGEVEKYLKLGSEHATSAGIRIPGRGGEEGFYFGGGSHAAYNLPTLSLPFHPSSLPTHGFYGFPPSSGLAHLHGSGPAAGLHGWAPGGTGGGYGGHVGFGSFGQSQSLLLQGNLPTSHSHLDALNSLSRHPHGPHGPHGPHAPSLSHTHSQSLSAAHQSLSPLSPHVHPHSLTPPAALGASPHAPHPLTPPNAATPSGTHSPINPLSASASNSHVLAGHAGSVPANASQFPRRVRKTSFDHTVAKEGIGALGGLGGRHQVNGRPVWVEGGRGSTLVRCFLPTRRTCSFFVGQTARRCATCGGDASRGSATGLAVAVCIVRRGGRLRNCEHDRAIRVVGSATVVGAPGPITGDFAGPSTSQGVFPNPVPGANPITVASPVPGPGPEPGAGPVPGPSTSPVVRPASPGAGPSTGTGRRHGPRARRPDERVPQRRVQLQL